MFKNKNCSSPSIINIDPTYRLQASLKVKKNSSRTYPENNRDDNRKNKANALVAMIRNGKGKDVKYKRADKKYDEKREFITIQE